MAMGIYHTPAALLSNSIGELREWGLIMSYPCWRFPRHLAVERLVQQFGNQPKLETILGRLRCDKCRQAPGGVEAKRADPFAARVSSIMLLETKGAVDRNRG